MRAVSQRELSRPNGGYAKAGIEVILPENNAVKPAASFYSDKKIRRSLNIRALLR